MRKRQRVGACSVLTGPGIKPRRGRWVGLAASSRHDLDRHAADGNCMAQSLVERGSRVEGGLGVFGVRWRKERELICSLGVLLARDYRTQGCG